MPVVDGLGINCNYREGNTLDRDIPFLDACDFRIVRQLIVAYYSPSAIQIWNGWLNVARQQRYKRIIVGLGNGARRMGVSNWEDFEDAVLLQADYLASLNDPRIEYQISNELALNLDGTFTAAQGRERQRQLATKVKQRQPSLTISIATDVYTGQEVRLWHQEGKGDLDRIGFNNYGPWPSFVARVREIESLFPNNVGYISEWGTERGISNYSNHRLHCEDVRRRLALLIDSGIQEFLYYGFKEHQNEWGAITTDGQPRLYWPVLTGAQGITK